MDLDWIDIEVTDPEVRYDYDRQSLQAYWQYAQVHRVGDYLCCAERAGTVTGGVS